MSQADAREAFGVTEASLYALQPARGVPADTFRDAVAAKAADYAAEPSPRPSWPATWGGLWIG